MLTLRCCSPFINLNFKVPWLLTQFALRTRCECLVETAVWLAIDFTEVANCHRNTITLTPYPRQFTLGKFCTRFLYCTWHAVLVEANCNHSLVPIFQHFQFGYPTENVEIKVYKCHRPKRLRANRLHGDTCRDTDISPDRYPSWCIADGRDSMS